MNPTLHERAMQLFSDLVELPAEARDRELAQRTPDDFELRREVESLLEWDDDSDRDDLAPPLTATPRPERIGPYEILDELGVGGTSIVYRARESRPSRLVALKVIHDRRAGRLLRFRREAELLSRLRHPGIAQLYSFGQDELGERPFLAMELIDGRPLTAFAAERGLGVRARIDLLIDVCFAVEHAHRHGIIHRDLKPANILVEDSPDGPRAKVLDFGIARLLQREGAGPTQQTNVAQVVGTLAYMSPEQLNSAADVDTRTDVYSLGAVGYELLCGAPPIAVDRTAPLQAMRDIESARPTPLVSRRPSLGRELSLIFDKALRKDRAERYESVADFRADLVAVLAGEPVRAHPPSVFYVAQKFVRRNPIIVGAVAAALVLIVGSWLAVSGALLREWEARQQVDAQLDRATRSARFLVRQVTAQLSVIAGAGSVHLELLERLREEISFLRDQFPDAPELIADEAAVLTQLSGALVEVDRVEEALTYRRRAVSLREQLVGARPDAPQRVRDYATALIELGDVHRGHGSYELGISLYREAHTILERLFQQHPELDWARDDLTWSYERLGHHELIVAGRLEQAEEHFLRRRALLEPLIEADPERLTTLHGLASSEGLLSELRLKQGRPDDALEHAVAAEAASDRLIQLAPRHRLYLQFRICKLRQLAQLLLRNGCCIYATELYAKATALGRRLVELDPHDRTLHQLHLDAAWHSRKLARRINSRKLAECESTLAEAMRLARLAGFSDAELAGIGAAVAEYDDDSPCAPLPPR